ncbi:protein phosphatase 1 regulatory subunit 3B [Thalassophryne amazonica]|uniref:protein phosphatase 1 regulatory subunit 3B n=1 Tax=Thalassophryne amazonica TaxID=390379 RepID=UPI00147117B7|nr:protein phosphatase 1 regulatory subunit 3B [Thalassophryne amazonica]
MMVDMALPLCLSKEGFVYRKTLKGCEPHLNSCLRFAESHCLDPCEPTDSSSSRKESGKAKKHVTFADHKGRSLTKVKVFSEFSDVIEIPQCIQEVLDPVPSRAPEEEQKPVLDFTQPSSDYLHFHQSLESNYICLEYCTVKDKTLAGTVKVKNLSFEKSVMVRMTFDSWKSYKDVECAFMKDAYPNPSTDTFSFEVLLPDGLRPHEHIEFAICYHVGGSEYWDSNQGKNYRILWSSVRGHDHNSHSSFDPHFDRYGSPTCSHGLFPDWPSYAGYENLGPYY